VTRYAEGSKERVRDATDLLALVETRTELSRKGVDSYFGRCPFHDERTASFHVRPQVGVYYCFGCHAKGDAFSFLMETEGLGFVEAMESLAERAGVELEREEEDPGAAERRGHEKRLLEVLERAAAWYARALWESDDAERARAYLLGRGLSEETLRAFGVGWAPEAWDRVLVASRRAGWSEEELFAAGLVQRGKGGRVFDRFRERIIFPLADERARVRGFGARAMREDQGAKYLNSAEGPVFSKGRQLFALDRARRPAATAGEVVLAEGYTDVLALHQAGVATAVGLMGTALTEDQVGVLARTAKTVVLALDADRAGQEAMLKAARLAEGRGLELRVVGLPEGSDPADLLASEGAEALRTRFGRSMPFVVFRVERALAEADTGSAEGRDRALTELRPLVRGLPPSIVREELVQRIAAHLQLPETLVATLGGGGRGRPGSGAPDGSRGTRPAPVAAALDRRERTERDFLALVLALPAPGAEALARLDPDAHFTTEATRRAARHIAAHPSDPLAGVAEEDAELGALLARITARAERLRATRDLLRQAEFILDLGRTEREIASARAERRPHADLAAHRDRVRRGIEELELG